MCASLTLCHESLVISEVGWYLKIEKLVASAYALGTELF